MLKLLKNLKKRDYILIIACVVFIAIQVWLDLKVPDYMSNITMLVQTEGSAMPDILKEGAWMLLCTLGSLSMAILVGYCASSVGASFGKIIRKKVFSKVESLSMEDIKKFSTSSLITRTTNDISQVQMLIVMALQVLIKSPIMASWAISKIANKGLDFAIIPAIAVAIILVLVTFLIILVLPKFKIIQKLTDNLNRITRENLTGIRVVRAYNAEDYQSERFEKANDELTKTNMFTQKSMAIMYPVIGTIMAGINLSIYWLGAHLINQAQVIDRMNIFSNMVIFSSYAMQILFSFMMLIMIFILYPRASVSAKRINEVLDTNEKITSGKIKNNKNGLVGVIEFRDVSFKYPDAEEYILKNISFTANKGETVAFIGSTGSGKSTLINLVPRFYDVTDGEILIDGINVKDMDLEYLHNKIGYVSQKAIMFKGSVESNVSFGDMFGKKPDIKKVKKAIEVAQGKDFVEKMENKYESEIAQGGTNISGGQKQRLSIARAISREPEIYIFDDTFSALDYKTDFLLRKNLKNHTENATSLIVAQRIGTIKDADKIIVLDEGMCVGSGKHEELLKTCKVYQEIASSQLSLEEIERG